MFNTYVDLPRQSLGSGLDDTVELEFTFLWPDGQLVDFQGVVVKGQQFAQRYHAAVTPTLLFLDRDGKSLAQPLIGTSNLEFYGFYLDRRIEEARAKL